MKKWILHFSVDKQPQKNGSELTSWYHRGPLLCPHPPLLFLFLCRKHVFIIVLRTWRSFRFHSPLPGSLLVNSSCGPNLLHFALSWGQAFLLQLVSKHIPLVKPKYVGKSGDQRKANTRLDKPMSKVSTSHCWSMFSMPKIRTVWQECE